MLHSRGVLTDVSGERGAIGRSGEARMGNGRNTARRHPPHSLVMGVHLGCTDSVWRILQGIGVVCAKGRFRTDSAKQRQDTRVRFNEGMTGRACTAMQFSDKQPDEMDADRFAAHLLLPRAGIDAMLAKHATDAEPSWPTILRLEQYFRVSHEAMLWRLLDVGYFRNRKQMEEYRPGVIRQARMLRYDTSIYRPGGAHEVLSEVPEKTHRAIEQGLISQGWANELLDAMGVDHSDAGRVDDDQLD